MSAEPVARIADADEPTTSYAVFEGLFARATRPEGAFLEDLRRIGFDPKRPEPKYPSRVWADAVEVARRHLYPQLPKHEGEILLGRQFIRGYFETIAGRVVQVMLPFLPGDAFIKRFPRFYMASRTHVSIETIRDAPKEYRLIFTGRHTLPYFVVGMLDGDGQRSANLEVLSTSENGFVLRFRVS